MPIRHSLSTRRLDSTTARTRDPKLRTNVHIIGLVPIDAVVKRNLTSRLSTACLKWRGRTIRYAWHLPLLRQMQSILSERPLQPRRSRTEFSMLHAARAACNSRRRRRIRTLIAGAASSWEIQFCALIPLPALGLVLPLTRVFPSEAHEHCLLRG